MMSRIPRELLVGAAAGLAGSLASSTSERCLDRLVSPEQKRRERAVRTGSAHQVAATALGRALSSGTAGKLVFGLAYGLGWGLIYAAVRRRAPQVGSLLGLPFAVPFYLMCDGAIAPLLRLSPVPTAVPWQQLNAKELGNHVAWTATAELLTRSLAQAGARGA